MFRCLDEPVADMVVDPDAAHAESEHAKRVLVIVGQRALADCVRGEKKEKETKLHSNTKKFNKLRFSDFLSEDISPRGKL